MSAKELFNQLLADVVAGVNAMAAEGERPADKEFVSTAFAILGLAISRLPLAEGEARLMGVEEALRRAVAMYPDKGALRYPQVPNGYLH